MGRSSEVFILDVCRNGEYFVESNNSFKNINIEISYKNNRKYLTSSLIEKCKKFIEYTDDQNNDEFIDCIPNFCLFYPVNGLTIWIGSYSFDLMLFNCQNDSKIDVKELNINIETKTKYLYLRGEFRMRNNVIKWCNSTM